MKAVISSTYDDKYFWFVPLTTWLWNRLGIDVICILPLWDTKQQIKNMIVMNAMQEMKFSIQYFKCPKHKEATYSQISRLYAAAIPGLDNKEVLISSDVDMGVFRNIFSNTNGLLWNMGFDLVPDSQLPMCYTWGEAWHWDMRFDIKGKSLQECLDEQLANEECENMRGNLWSRDQELLKNAFSKHNYDSTVRVPRARPGTQFAANRLDRDDAYLLERLNPDIIDYHMPRPGYEENNFNQIMTVLKYFYPQNNFDWLISYRNEYLKLL